jgi:hypothetical protein
MTLTNLGSFPKILFLIVELKLNHKQEFDLEKLTLDKLFFINLKILS